MNKKLALKIVYNELPEQTAERIVELYEIINKLSSVEHNYNLCECGELATVYRCAKCFKKEKETS